MNFTNQILFHPRLLLNNSRQKSQNKFIDLFSDNLDNMQILWLNKLIEDFYYDFTTILISKSAPRSKPLQTLVEKQQSFIRFYMLPNTFWRILDDSYKIFHA